MKEENISCFFSGANNLKCARHLLPCPGFEGLSPHGQGPLLYVRFSNTLQVEYLQPYFPWVVSHLDLNERTVVRYLASVLGRGVLGVEKSTTPSSVTGT